MPEFTITPLRRDEIEEVARLHVSALNYSFNSQLGVDHVSLIYEGLLSVNGARAFVARMAGEVIGVVSGLVDSKLARRTVLRTLGIRGVARMVVRAFISGEVLQALRREITNHSIPKYDGEEVRATLSAIAVSDRCRRMGVAISLVKALEDFFRQSGVRYYWLDTVPENFGAQNFYWRAGFDEVSRSTNRVVYLKHLIS